MRIGSSAFSNDFLNQIQNLEQQQNTLQQQASSGLKVSAPEDDPSIMDQVLNQQTSSAANTQYQGNITQLQSAATTASTAMNSLQTIVSRVNEIATLASSGTTSKTQFASYASEMQSLIQQAVQIGNTQDAEGHYIFSGTAITTPSFTATTNASGNVTGVAYAGNSEVAQSQIGPQATVTAQVPGGNSSGTGADGLFSDSRTGADLFSHMISLQQNLVAGNSAAISSTNVPALTIDENNVINQVSANGVMQSALTAAASTASSQNTNLATQISGETNADLAQTLTELNQTQTAYQAALESGTMVMKMSLLNYLS